MTTAKRWFHLVFLVGLWLLSCVTVDSLLKFGLGILCGIGPPFFYLQVFILVRFGLHRYGSCCGATSCHAVLTTPQSWSELESFCSPVVVSCYIILKWQLDHFPPHFLIYSTNMAMQHVPILNYNIYFILYIIFVPCKRHFSTGRISLLIFRRGYSLSQVFLTKGPSQYYQWLWM